MLIKNVKIVLGLIVMKGVNVIATALYSFRKSNLLRIIVHRKTTSSFIPK